MEYFTFIEMTDSIEQKGNKSIKQDQKLSPEELAASLVDFVKMKVWVFKYLELKNPFLGWTVGVSALFLGVQVAWETRIDCF